MKRFIIPLILVLLIISACKNDNKQNKDTPIETSELKADTQKPELAITPISHATMVLEYGNETIYVDPVGGKAAFKHQKKPTIVLITDIHPDHYEFSTLKDIDLNETIFVIPQAVADKFPADFNPMHKVLNNGESTTIKGISIKAIPMYNLREEALKFHPKGRGNGYVLTLGNKRVYISGDTEDIPEMRNLKNIDIAFVCMNLPYTMPVESAADAVLEFKPKKVYPYHYRGTDGLSDVGKFKQLVNQGDDSIDVVQLDWYPNKKSDTE